MKRTLLSFLAVIGGFMTASKLTNEDIEALRSLTELHVSQVRTGDWGGLCATFHPDVVRMPPDQLPVEGRNSVAQWLKSLPRVIHVENRIDAVGGSPDCAYMREHNQITLEIQGNIATFNMKWLGVHQKQSSGSWVISADIWNLNPAAG
jgi:ketosteroid isomerase-like protein